MRNKLKKYKIILAFFFAFTIICSFSQFFVPQAEALSTTWDTWYYSHMQNGVGQSGNNPRNYWFDTNTLHSTALNSTWQTRVDNAMYAWCHTGSQGCGVYTSVWFYRTTTKSTSVIDFYKTNLGNGVYGLTHFYTGSGSSSVEFYPHLTPQNWVWAKIELNTTYSDSSASVLTTSTKKLVMVEHEIGHAFGLAHVNNSTAVMHYNPSEFYATRPSPNDCNGVNALYGGYNP